MTILPEIVFFYGFLLIVQWWSQRIHGRQCEHVARHDRSDDSVYLIPKRLTEFGTGHLNGMVEHWQHGLPTPVTDGLVLETAHVQLEHLGEA